MSIQRSMSGRQEQRAGERGMVTLEFTFVAVIYLTMLIAIVAGGTVWWAHNTLMDATRRGARYASTQCDICCGSCPGNGLTPNTLNRIKNMVVFGNPAGTGQPVVPGLTTGNVKVQYANDPIKTTLPFGITKGIVAVSICQSAQNFTVCPGTTDNCTAYRFNYVFDKASNLIQMPEYRTALPGESAGYIPDDK
jgi:Flp pilus assembly protein TadG